MKNKSNVGVKKLLEHCDREEIISKLIIGISTLEIHTWLSAKYPTEKKMVISEAVLKIFKDHHLDVYKMLQDDMNKVKQAQIDEDITLVIQDNPTYKSRMMELVGKELDVKKMITNLCLVIEQRAEQIFNMIQEDPRNLNTRTERILIEYFDTLQSALERYYKIVEAPAAQSFTQNNVSIQVIDSHVMIIQECIRETLQEIDMESSFLFIDRLNEKMAKLKLPAPDSIIPTETKLAEVKLLNESINQKLNQP